MSSIHSWSCPFVLSVGILLCCNLHGQETYIDKDLSSGERARIYLQLAREEQSDEMYRQAAEQFEIALADASSPEDSIHLLPSIALTKHKLGDSEGARKNMQKALDLASANFGEESDIFIDMLIRSAMICNLAQDYRQSYRLLGQCKKSSPDFYRNTALKIKYLLALAMNDARCGKNLKAFREARKSSRLIGKKSGTDSEEYINSLMYVSGYAADAFLQNTAVRYHRKAASYSSIVLERFAELSEAGRSRLWKESARYFENTLEIAKTTGSLEKEAYDAILFSKGILLTASTAFGDFVRKSGDSTAIADYDRIGRLMVSGAPDKVIDSLDQKIVHRLQELGLKFTDKTAVVSWKDVRNSLGKDDLAVEFFGSASHGFGAVLLRKDWTKPKIVTLEKNVEIAQPVLSKALQKTVRKKNTINWADSLGTPRKAIETAESNKLYWQISKAIWPNRIRKHFPRTRDGRVYFSPSGELNLSGLEYLPAYKPSDRGNESPVTLADTYKMYRLSSTGRLVNKATPPLKDTMKAGVYGGVDYEAQPGRLRHGINYVLNGGRETVDSEYEDNLNDGINVAPDKLQPLPASVLEVHTISSILDNANVQVDLLTGRYASEDAFKHLSTGERIIHVATHSFYVKPSAASKHNYYKRLIKTNPQYITDPLNRSGVLLAGAQKNWDGWNGNLNGLEDGVLTSKEISWLDLRNTDLIILSGCKTGLGDVANDGVYGLQRAFKKAGANAMILSLWPVDDNATQYMMNCFYRNLFVLKMPMREAFVSALRLLRMKPEYSSPYYWASFILLDPYESVL